MDPAPPVRARRPPVERWARLRFRERIAPTLWFLPSLMVLGAIVLSRLTVWIDDRVEIELGLVASTDAAAGLTSTAASAMLSLVAVVFSTTLVAIQLAGGQYSPRVVRFFVRSRLTHVTLGIFLATFVVSLGALVEIRERDTLPGLTVLTVYLLMITTLFVFIAFVYGTSKLMRVQYLLDAITLRGHETFEIAFPHDEAYVRVPAPALGPGCIVRCQTAIGGVQAVDRVALVELATRCDVVIELLVEMGEYIGVGTPVARVHGPGRPPTGDEVTEHLLLGTERTDVQDPGFALRQLVDIASRALSPAINDPTTAVQCIDRITDLLGSVAHRDEPGIWWIDGAGSPRLSTREPDLDRLLLLGFVEIIRYGASSPQVVRRLRAAIDVLLAVVQPEVRPTVLSLRGMLDHAAHAEMPAAFHAVALEPDRHGFG